MGRKKKDNQDKKPKVHKNLDGLNIDINTFGEVNVNIDVDKLNEFLDENVEDKKLTDDQIKSKDEEE